MTERKNYLSSSPSGNTNESHYTGTFQHQTTDFSHANLSTGWTPFIDKTIGADFLQIPSPQLSRPGTQFNDMPIIGGSTPSKNALLDPYFMERGLYPDGQTPFGKCINIDDFINDGNLPDYQGSQLFRALLGSGGKESDFSFGTPKLKNKLRSPLKERNNINFNTPSQTKPGSRTSKFITPGKNSTRQFSSPSTIIVNSSKTEKETNVKDMAPPSPTPAKNVGKQRPCTHVINGNSAFEPAIGIFSEPQSRPPIRHPAPPAPQQSKSKFQIVFTDVNSLMANKGKRKSNKKSLKRTNTATGVSKSIPPVPKHAAGAAKGKKSVHRSVSVPILNRHQRADDNGFLGN